jgi:hypothetical protein
MKSKLFYVYFSFIVFFKLPHNGVRLGEEADFGALNCQHTTKFDARQNAQLTTEPAFFFAKPLLAVRAFSLLHRTK